MINLVEYEIIPNEQYDSNEVYFKSRPAPEVIQALKSIRMRWNPRKGCWYGFSDSETIESVISGAGSGDMEPIAATQRQRRQPMPPREKTNKYGVKVGDIFSASWGYDQTQTDYFQVVALVGEQSVRVREVYPERISSRADGPMAETSVYKLDRSKMLPAATSSVFINDQERGDIKRIQMWGDTPSFRLSSFANAYLCKGDTDTAYDSWYR